MGLVIIVPAFALMMQTDEVAGADAVSKIAFTRIPDEVDTRDIYVMNADGNGLTQLTTEGEESSPAWSPDGSKIAYESYHPSPSGNSDIYVMNADGSNKTNLTNTPGQGDGVQEVSPDWSPDGSKIAFARTPDEVDTRNIYVMNADGSGVTQLTTAGEETRPAWSPDGSKIAFTSYRDGNHEIYVMNADGSNQTNLTNTPGLFGEGVQELSPAWSPDGSKIAFDRSSDSGNTSDIYVMNADGSGVTQLTTTEGEHHPAWSPDGSKIAYESYHPFSSGNTDIYVMNADGSDQTNLTNTPGEGDGVDELSPDWGVSAAPPTETVTEEVSAGQTPTTVTTDAEEDGATPSDPVETHLTIPAGVGGTVSITETSTTQQPPAGFSFLDQQVELTAPAATPNNPLTLELRIDSSLVPAGTDPNSIQVFRNGTLVEECTDPSASSAQPDPCVASRETLTSGDVSVTVRTSQASAWNFGVQEDTTAPTTTASATAGGNAYNSGNWTNKDVTLTLTADDGQGGSGVEKITYSATGAQPIGETAYDPQNPPKITTEGQTTITYYATDIAGYTEDEQIFTVKIDKTAPKVQVAAPTNGATQVSRATNVVATFAEAMNSATLSKTTFKLYKGTTQISNVRVTPSADGTRATLNPYGSSGTVLAKNTTYVAVVSTGAKDLAGNSLDQTSRITGNQPMLWSFKTGSK